MQLIATMRTALQKTSQGASSTLGVVGYIPDPVPVVPKPTAAPPSGSVPPAPDGFLPESGLSEIKDGWLTVTISGSSVAVAFVGNSVVGGGP